MENDLTYGSTALQQDVLIEAAVYARLSDADRQRETSIDDQVRECRDAARRRGFVIPDANVFADADVRGSVVSRPGLDRLRALIESGEATFSALFVADTSRLARNTALAPQLRKFFAYHEIKLFFVENGMESGSSGFVIQHQFLSGFDEHHSEQLAEKVKRGQLSAVLRGRRPSGHCYGYRPLRIEHPTRLGEWGRSEVLGVDDEIHPAEESVILDIANLYADGFGGYMAIARELNRREVRPPGTPMQNTVSCWNHAAVRTILNNRRYIGIIEYNRTKTLRDPGTGQIKHRKRDKSEVVVVEKPALRIIPQDLWDRVQARMKLQREQFGKGKSGGLGRKMPGRIYLFAGLLKCGVCGGSMILKNAGGPYGAYYCSNRFRGVGCANQQKVRLRSLEQALILKLVEAARSTVNFERLKELFVAELTAERKRREAMAEGSGERLRDLRKEFSDLTRGLENLAEEIASHGGNEILRSVSQRKEARLAAVKKAMGKLEAPIREVKVEEIDGFLHQELDQLAATLLSDPLAVKQELNRRISSLTLTPVELDGQPGIEITGDLALFTSENSFLHVDTVDSITMLEYNHLSLTQNVFQLDEFGDVVGTSTVTHTDLVPGDDAGAAA